RYDLDVSFLRIYEGGKPAKTPDYFKWSRPGTKEGELTFVAGNPGGTDRLLTIAQLEAERDVTLPTALFRAAELRGMLTEYGHRGAEQKRTANSTLFYVENGFKARKGRHEALLDKRFFESKVLAERALRAKVDADPKLKAAYGGAWDAIALALEKYRPIRKRHLNIEESRAFSSELFTLARTLVRSADELPKPNDQRLREYTDAKLPALKQQLFSPAPIYTEFEIATFTFSLTKLRETLGPDDPFVKRVFGKQSPEEIAAKLIKGTKLKEVKVRQALFAGGKKAVDASTDPMILFAREIDPDARAVRKTYEDEVEAPLKKNGELIARAVFAIFGTSNYPDATFTPRLSFGTVKGYLEEGREVKPITTFAGAYERDTGRFPFALPRSWLLAKPRLDLATPFNFCSDNDIIGGNSGSPVVDQNAEVVGLVFDGNIQSLGGDFGFDVSVNRAVSVHSSAILEALDKVYGARRLVDELRPATAAK
ncbi:MAG: S46 family peptidase, partial [Myxococcaceae bacterium]